MTEDPREPDRLETKPIEQPSGQQEDSTPQRKKPKHEFPKSQVGKLWDAFGSPEEPANILPQAKYSNSAELNKQHDLSIKEIVKSGNGISDIKSFYKAPCARDSLMLGMGAGFGIGGVRAVIGGLRAVWPACSWAVYSFAATCIISFELCQRRRREELDGMKQAVEMMREIHLKRQREKEQKGEEVAAMHAEEEKKRKSWTNPSNYKFW